MDPFVGDLGGAAGIYNSEHYLCFRTNSYSPHYNTPIVNTELLRERGSNTITQKQATIFKKLMVSSDDGPTQLLKCTL